MKITRPVRIYGDNLGVVNNCTSDSSMLKKKHVAVAYHMVREAVAANMIEVCKIRTSENLADLFTKALPGTVLNRLLEKFLY
jgi:predicted component of type VI protein secretion system